MDLNSVALATGIMAGMGAFLAFLLAVASRVFYVYEDPRIDQVDHLLPGANCGACGLPGCRAFAVGVVAGETAPGACTVAPEESRERIAALLGVAVGGEEKQVARLACAGGSHVARQRAAYVGEPTCRAADLVAGGGKGCSWGCLGLADCVTVCDFEALQMDSFALPVVDEVLCTACGDCVDICPKHLFSLRPVSQRLWVACQNLLFGDPADGPTAFDVALAFKEALESGDNSAIQESISALKDAHERSTLALTQIGFVLKDLSAAQSFEEDKQYQAQILESQLSSADIAKAASELAFAENVYEASLSTARRLTQTLRSETQL